MNTDTGVSPAEINSIGPRPKDHPSYPEIHAKNAPIVEIISLELELDMEERTGSK